VASQFRQQVKTSVRCCTLVYSSGSQTFPVRGPLRKIWGSAKIYIGIGGPLQLISRTTSGPRSRLWESLVYMFQTKCAGDILRIKYVVLNKALKISSAKTADKMLVELTQSIERESKLKWMLQTSMNRAQSYKTFRRLFRCLTLLTWLS